uniref:Uncharacterized protein n=1 Tax=Tetranychus urticae TaxID=32264 RepID=T1JPN5_TETUR
MVFKLLLSFLLRTQQAPFIDSLIDKLSNTRPIRRSAQLAAYFINRGSQAYGKDLQGFFQSSGLKAIKDKFSGAHVSCDI